MMRGPLSGAGILRGGSLRHLLAAGARLAVPLVVAIGATLQMADGQALAALDEGQEASSCPTALRCAGGVQAASLAQDFGDGQRLPLSTIGIPAGVIVVVNGRNIAIVRRDGTEMRLKGVLSGDPPTADASQKPLIRNDEVWVRAADLPDLLARPCTCGAGVQTIAQQSAPQVAQFQTFEVPSPTLLRPTPKPKPVWRPRRLPSLPVEEQEGKSWLEVSPVETSLGLCRVGGLAAPGIRASYQELVGPSLFAEQHRNRNLDPRSPVSRVLSYVTMEAEEGRRRYQAGDAYHPLLGWGTGIGFTAPVSATAELGASVVVPEDLPGQEPDGQIALQARLRPQPALGLEAEIAGDGSYHALARVKKPGLLLLSSVLDLPDRQHRDTWWQKQLWAGLALVGRISSSAGEYEANAQAAGLRWDRGPWHVIAERDRTVVAQEETVSSSLWVSWIRPRLFAALRYMSKETGGGQSGFEWTIARTDANGRELSLSSLGPQEGEGAAYRLGASLPLGRDLRARASLEWGPSGTYPECKLEWRRSREQLVVLRYGMSYPELDDQKPEPALALYANIAFGRTSPGGSGECRIIGSVKDDGGQGVADVVVLLDDTTEAITREDGSFELAGVEEGVHTIRLDANRLHADLGADCRARTVVTGAEAPAQADFLVIRLCRIGGEVSVTPVLPDGTLGQPEPLAGVELECRRAGAVLLSKEGPQDSVMRTTSDERGRYSFTGLRPGRYLVCLREDQPASSGLTLAPPSQWTFALQAGEGVSGANFVFQSRQRPIIFTEVTSPSP